MLLALLASIVIAVTPKHGHVDSTYVISFKAPYATSRATNTNYVVGALNSTAQNCHRGISSFGKVQSGPYKAGQTVRFVMRFKSGFCRHRLAKALPLRRGPARRPGGGAGRLIAADGGVDRATGGHRLS